MTATELATAALTKAFPNVEFRVRQEFAARGTNESVGYLSVSYNAVKNSDIAPSAVSTVVPNAQVWAVGRRA